MDRDYPYPRRCNWHEHKTAISFIGMQPAFTMHNNRLTNLLLRTNHIVVFLLKIVFLFHYGERNQSSEKNCDPHSV